MPKKTCIDLADDYASQNDTVKYCPECETPNQFGELCSSCSQDIALEEAEGFEA